MSNLSNTTVRNDSSSSSGPGIPPIFRFWSYLFFEILSLIFTLFVLYYLLIDRILRQALHNHVIIVLLFLGLIYEFTDIPWILYYNHTGVPMFQTPVFYIFWVFLDYAFYSLQIALFAWATIERHILIFHDKWLATRKKRLFVHYVPVIAIIIYYLIYYSIVHFAPFCENSFDDFLAGGIFIPCLFSRTILGSWDLIVHQVIPTFIISISSVLLILRVVWQKKRLNQPVTWRRHRKMTIQLISLSCLYIIFNFPWTFLIFAFQYGLPADVVSIPLIYAAYLYYYVIFLFPIACFGSFTELQMKLKKKLLWWRKQQEENTSKVTATRTLDGITVEITKTVT